jgi:hypothetical protein
VVLGSDLAPILPVLPNEDEERETSEDSQLGPNPGGKSMSQSGNFKPCKTMKVQRNVRKKGSKT